MEADVRTDSAASPGPETPPPHTLEPEKQFILVYESQPQLWDTSDIRYSNRFERYKALGKLLPIYKKVKPYATIEDVKKKINSLRSNFRRELKKFIASEKSGAGASEMYYPKVWYFPYLHFLRKLEHPDNLFPDEPIARLEEMGNQKNIKRERITSSPEAKTSPPPPKMKRKTVREKFCPDQYYSQPYQQEHQFPNISNPIALEWADTLERLDPLQRLYAKKAINDILFEAELGNLHKHSIRINEPNSYYLPTSSPAHTSSLHSPLPQSSPSHPDPISINHKEDSTSDIEYKIPITLCNLESQTQDSGTSE